MVQYGSMYVHQLAKELYTLAKNAEDQSPAQGTDIALEDPMEHFSYEDTLYYTKRIARSFNAHNHPSLDVHIVQCAKPKSIKAFDYQSGNSIHYS